MSSYELAVELSRLGARDRLRARRGLCRRARLRRHAAHAALDRHDAEGLGRARPLVHRDLRGAAVGARALAERRRRRRHARRSRTASCARRRSSRRSSGPGGTKITLANEAERRACTRSTWNGTTRLARAEGQMDVHRHRDRRPQRHDDARRGRSRSTTRFVARRSRRPRGRPTATLPADAPGDRRRAGRAADRRARGDAPLGEARGRAAAR